MTELCYIVSALWSKVKKKYKINLTKNKSRDILFRKPHVITIQLSIYTDGRDPEVIAPKARVWPGPIKIYLAKKLAFKV